MTDNDRKDFIKSCEEFVKHTKPYLALKSELDETKKRLAVMEKVIKNYIEFQFFEYGGTPEEQRERVNREYNVVIKQATQEEEK